MTIISSWGHPSANAYISLSAAHSYATTALLNATAWTNATTALREAALMQAARDIDAGSFYGARYYYDQNLEFPRRGAVDYPYLDQVVIDISESPFQTRMKQDVEQASVIQANYRLQGTLEQHLINRNLGVTSHSEGVGPLNEAVTYGGAAGGGSSFAATVHPDVRNLLSKYRVGRRIWRG